MYYRVFLTSMAETQPPSNVPKIESVITNYYISAKYLMVRTIWLV